MKVEYDLTDKYLRYYNEACGIFILRKKLKKNQNIRISGYITQMLLWAFGYCVFILVFRQLFIMLELYNSSFNSFFLIVAIFLIVVAIDFSYKYSINKKYYRKGSLELNNDGVLNKVESGIQTQLPYNQIDLVTITNSIIVFILKRRALIFIKNENVNKDKLIETIREYSDVQIIDKTNKLV